MSETYDEKTSDHEDGIDRTTPLFFLFFMSLVAMVLILGRALHHRPKLNSFLSEPAMVLLVGMSFSFLIKAFVPTHTVDNTSDMETTDDVYAAAKHYDEGSDGMADQNKFFDTALSFSGEIFFMALLPPILFQSGYELKRELFFRHIKPIVSFAAVGTTLSGLVTGFMLWGIQQAGWLGVVQLTLLELLTFGALIAATDTVSVLGVLQAKKVDPHLFSLVFGESALNDAVAIVLFRSFSHLVQIGIDDTRTLMGEAALFATEFLLEALGSPALGICFSFLAALVFKHLDFRGTPTLELSLYILIMYIPFILAEICHLSGIVTIFFTGMSARRYIEPNVSEETQRNAAVIFKLVAFLAETCIFLDLGLSVFGFSGSFHWQFVIFSFVAALVGRAASIYPISFLFNLSLKETVTEPLLPAASSPGGLLKDAEAELTSQDQPSTAVINNMDAIYEPDLIALAGRQYDDDCSSEASSSSSTVSSYSSKSNGMGKFGKKKRRRRKTPEKRQDKVIPLKFMHVLWFVGLRGAVAYACARDFPDLYGNNDEVVAATMFIVLVTIILMGGFCEPLLHLLGIRMDVNDEEYMKEWRLRRSLKGAFHYYEERYVFNVVVKGTDKNATGDDGMEMVRESKTGGQATLEPEQQYELTDADGNLRSVGTNSTSSHSNDGSTPPYSAPLSARRPIPESLDLPPMA
ncbi:sodium/hydrogen exchanger [Nitzschia inconspicua]|uniref:Sodium/hydrogen exchanger n=1 Tax=Nitzschia inconspicua TaxID=303405 RepID=A0A9K3L534_9STRA|nr:sodium/hydrogen exchanger [Nitzschia inconspicua]